MNFGNFKKFLIVFEDIILQLYLFIEGDVAETGQKFLLRKNVQCSKEKIMVLTDNTENAAF